MYTLMHMPAIKCLSNANLQKQIVKCVFHAYLQKLVLIHNIKFEFINGRYEHVFD